VLKVKNFLQCYGVPILISAIAFAVRYPLIHRGTPFYNSDTSIVDLMARHFARGEFSIYYWGGRYYGALDPVLLVPLFKIFGYSPLVSQMVPYFFSATFLVMYYWFLIVTTDFFTACVATLILAVGAPYFLGVTFTTYNYILSLNFSMAFFLMLRKIVNRTAGRWYVFLFGLLMGFSWYYLHSVLLFWIASFLSIVLPLISTDQILAAERWARSLTPKRIWNEWVLLGNLKGPSWLKRLLVLINLGNIGNLIVAVPLWFHGDWIGFVGDHKVKLFFDPIIASSLQLACLTLAIVFRQSIVAFVRTIGRQVSLPLWLSGFLIGYSPAIVGSLTGRPPAPGGNFPTLPEMIISVRTLFGEILPWMFDSSPNMFLRWCVILISWAGMGMLVFEAYRCIRKLMKGDLSLVIHPFVALAAVNLVICFFCAGLPNRWTGRYLLPFYICIPLGIAWFLRNVVRQRVICGILLTFFLISNLKANQILLANAPPMARYAPIAQYLSDHHYQGGYADYWIAYAITALSNENVILAPTGDNDRYPPYLSYVRSLKNVILLGEAPLPLQSVVTIKGMTYKVVGYDPNPYMPCMLLEK
jgi:hypothetical protein